MSVTSFEGVEILETREREGGTTLTVRGRWTLRAVLQLDKRLRELAETASKPVVVEATNLDALDSAGAWALRRTIERLKARGVSVEVEGLAHSYQTLLEKARLPDPDAEIEPRSGWWVLVVLDRMGRSFMHALSVGAHLLGFFGYTLVALLGVIVRPSRLRFTAVVAQIEATGLNAMPIVGLLCFLVGVVLAYMGAQQLERFGATVLTVNLVGVAVLREIGVLLAAIIVAGRSGSAFAAQIGTMKVNQEVDAMETMGLSTIDVLVLPRVIALVIALPLLTVFGDAMGLMGGAVVALFLLDLTIPQFMTQLATAVDMSSFTTGLIKAPVFAMVIALVGCYDGLKVSGSAESVGTYTTRAVVESIFIVIVLNALFTVAFAELGI